MHCHLLNCEGLACIDRVSVEASIMQGQLTNYAIVAFGSLFCSLI